MLVYDGCSNDSMTSMRSALFHPYFRDEISVQKDQLAHATYILSK